jgi:hypothetical protein
MKITSADRNLNININLLQKLPSTPNALAKNDPTFGNAHDQKETTAFQYVLNGSEVD